MLQQLLPLLVEEEGEEGECGEGGGVGGGRRISVGRGG